jgi:hypothetical protein
MKDGISPPEIPEPTGPSQSSPESSGGARYEPPRLIPAGSLREVLGKTGGRADFGYKTKKP